jgi:hypothetical protein
MSQNNYPLRLQASLLKELRKLAAEEGPSVTQLINVAVAEKLSALRTQAYFRERAQRANVPAALALLDRLGDEAPRPGDEVVRMTTARRPAQSTGQPRRRKAAI